MTVGNVSFGDYKIVSPQQKRETAPQLKENKGMSCGTKTAIAFVGGAALYGALLKKIFEIPLKKLMTTPLWLKSMGIAGAIFSGAYLAYRGIKSLFTSKS